MALQRVEGVADRASLRAEPSGTGEVLGGDASASGDQRGVQTRRRRRRRFAAAVSSRGGGGGGDDGGGGVVPLPRVVAVVLVVAGCVVVVVPRLAESGPREARVVGGGTGWLGRGEMGAAVGAGGGRAGVAPGGGGGGGDVAAKRADARVLGLVVGPVAEGGVGAAVVRRGEIRVRVRVRALVVVVVVELAGGAARARAAKRGEEIRVVAVETREAVPRRADAVVLPDRGRGVDVRVLGLEGISAQAEEELEHAGVHVRNVRGPRTTLEASDEHVERALLVQLGVDAEALAEGVERAANLARIRVGEGVMLRVVQAVVVRDGEVLLAGVHPDERLHGLREQSVHILAAPRAERRRHPSPRRRVARGCLK